jgi:hypothetical protein
LTAINSSLYVIWYESACLKFLKGSAAFIYMTWELWVVSMGIAAVIITKRQAEIELKIILHLWIIHVKFFLTKLTNKFYILVVISPP